MLSCNHTMMVSCNYSLTVVNNQDVNGELSNS